MQMSEEPKMPFTPEAFIQMLEWGATPELSPYTHKQIAEWCDRFWCQYLEADAPKEIKKILPILTGVETQWDLFLVNTYSTEELRTQNFDQVRLPIAWFHEWLIQAKA